MASTSPSITDEIERHPQTGQTDMMADARPGDLTERGKRSHDDLRGALIREVRRLAGRRSHHPLPNVDTAPLTLTRTKIEPMVRGLFPRAEHEVVLAALEKSVVFLSTANIEQILRGHDWDKSAWDIAKPVPDERGSQAPRHVTIGSEAGIRPFQALASTILQGPPRAEHSVSEEDRSRR